MKKLITMIGAAAAALGLYADAFTFTGSNFEQAGWSAGDSVIGVADDGTVGDSFWAQGDDAESTAKIAAEDTGKGDLIGEWKDGGSTKVVDIKTKLDKPVYRNVLADGTGVEMGECVFFDSLVKFTACDEPIDVTSLANDSKLAVWIREDEDNHKTNLFVTAGYFTDAGNTTVATNYDCGGISSYGIVPGEWCRLTIKTIADITNEDDVPGFAIFVNGNDGNATPVSCTESKGVAGSAITKLNNACAARQVKYIFPSIDQESGDKDKVVGVGFAGQGSVDEVTFTASDDSRAFAADPEIQMFTIKWADGDITALAINGEPVDISGKLSYSYPLIGVTELTVTPTFAEDRKMIYDWNGATYCTATYANGTITVTDFEAEGLPAITIQTMDNANGATVNGRTYPTIAEAVAYLNNLEGEQTLVIGDAISATASTDNNMRINNGGLTTLTIDLAGRTIKGAYYEIDGLSGGVIEIDSATDVTIVDNVGGGKVVADTNQPAVYAYDGKLTIVDGTYDGEVVIDSEDGTADGSLIGGKYLASANTDENDKFTLDAYVNKEGDPAYEAKLVDEDTYWEVAEKADEPFSGGTGAENDPYIIANVDDLVELQTKVADGDTFAGKFFQQTAEIDLAGEVWEGIGTPKSATAFAGTYDGNGQTIKNVTFAKSQYNGIFANVAGATIKNLTVTVAGFGGDDKSGEKKWGAAAIVGFSNGVTIEGCTAKGATDGTVFSGTHNIGGIGCRLEGEVLIKNCTNELALSTTYSKCGGFCAIASSQNKLDDVWFNGDITFEGCVNKADITTETTAGKDGVAGIVGYIQCVGSNKVESAYVGTTKTVNIKNCENQGTIAGGCPAAFVGKISSLGTQVLVGEISGNVVDEDALACGDSSANIDGLCYAKEGAYVANDTLAAGNTYLVTAKGMKPTIALAVGQSIIFDQTLATITTSGITAPAGYAIVPTGLEKVITYAPAIQNYNITYVYKTNDVEIAAKDIAGLVNSNPTSYTVENAITISAANITATDFDVASVDNEGWTAGAKTGDVTVTVTLTEKAGPTPINPDPTKPTEIEAQNKEAAEAKAATMDVGGMPTVEGLDQTAWNAYFDKTVSEGKDATHWNVTATLKPEIVKAETETTAVAAKLGDIAAAESGEVAVSITGAKPGLWYSLYEGAKLDNTRAEGNRAMADKDGKVTLQATHYDGSGFYQVKVNVANKK